MPNYLKGVQEVQRNLNRELRRIKANSFRNTIKAGYFIEEKSNEEVPVDTGYLKNSSYVGHAVNIATKNVIVTIGYSAIYAAKVHENPRAGRTGGASPQGKLYKTYAEKGKWKYLEDPLKNNMRTIINIIARGRK